MLEDALKSRYPKGVPPSVHTAIGQWRDSLIDTGGRNRLLNYRPTRWSTLEFSTQTMSDVLGILQQGEPVWLEGTVEERKAVRQDGAPDDAELLLDERLDEVEDATDSDEDESPKLFIKKTQREVQRIARRLASVSRLDFVERGLDTLYVGVGELEWIDEIHRNESRRSPLVLLPVVLESSGPKMPRRLVLSDERDVVVNPALALVMQTQHGIELPDVGELMDFVEAGDGRALLDRFEKVGLPKGWRLGDSATLTTFKFAKEAMYRDLLEHEQQVAESPLIQALSGAIPADRSEFLFDPHDDTDIDLVAPPEVHPLILDADSSQRSAVEAALEGKSFVLDGPPGTGKSQTIANMIASLIGQGKKVLFVSEKIVALEVVENRLAEVGLDPFLFVLHSSKSSRKEVATRLGRALDLLPQSSPGMKSSDLAQLRTSRETLSAYAAAVAEVHEPLGESYFTVLGWLEQTGFSDAVAPFDQPAVDLTPDLVARIKDSGRQLSGVWPMALKGTNSLWYGLERSSGIGLGLDGLRASLATLDPAQEALGALLRASGRDDIESLPVAWRIVQEWQKPGGYRDSHWLREMGLASHKDRVTIDVTLKTYVSQVTELQSVTNELRRLVGDDWSTLPLVHAGELSEINHLMTSTRRVDSGTAPGRLRLLSQELAKAVSALDHIVSCANALAQTLGAAAATTPSGVGLLAEASRRLLGEQAPFGDWLVTNADRRVRRDAFAAGAAARTRRDEARELALPHFVEGAPQRDLDQIAVLVLQNRSALKALSRGRRQMKSELALISHEKWKVAAEHLPEAVAWQAAENAHSAAVELAKMLLPEPQRTMLELDRPDWENLSARVENTDWMLETLHFVDPSRIAHLEVDVATRGVAHQQMLAVNDALSAWESAAERLDIPDLDACDLSVLNRDLNEQLRATERLVRFVDGQEQTGPHHETLAEYVRCAERRRAAETLNGDSRQTRNDLGAFIPLPEGSADSPWEGASEIEARHSWNEGMLALLRDFVDAPSRMTETLIDALEATPPSPDPTDSVREATSRINALLARFRDDRRSNLRAEFATLADAEDLARDFEVGQSEIDEWERLREVSVDLEDLGLSRAHTMAVSKRLDQDAVPRYLLAAALRARLEWLTRNDRRLQTSTLNDMDAIAQQFRALDAQLPRSAAQEIIDACAERRPRRMNGQAATIRHEASKKKRHIPVRDLIARSGDAIQAMHPCFMMSPLAVSQYLPSEMSFDVVIFDEASQVMPADSVNCVYRSNALIAAGDQKQLPPTSFFASGGVDTEDEEDEEDVATDYESLLDLMKSCGDFNSQSLKWHYRSRHESLIAFSNASFYESSLITFPGAIDRNDDLGVKFFKVAGIYDRSGSRKNNIEAKFVVDRILQHVTHDPQSSLGVVAFSVPQREAVETQLELAKLDHPELAALVNDDRQSGLFIKNLESVQGDERDIIIFSVGYGPDQHGSVYSNFGPVTQKGGDRRLNVAITRARRLVEVVSSMTSGQIRETGSDGVRHLKRYLDYAERGQAALATEISSLGIGPESPFEESVIDFVKGLGYDVETQVGVSGYRIDIGVRHPDLPGVFMMGIECDGAMYHSSRSARDRDRLRHDVLTNLGWNLYHVWGSDWYRNREKTKRRLHQALEVSLRSEINGTLTKPSCVVEVAPAIERSDVEVAGSATWAVSYPSNEYKLSWTIDFSNESEAYRLVRFVEEVVRAESPLHIDVLYQRLKESSSVDRVGARIKRTVQAAVDQANVKFDGTFVRSKSSRAVQVRQPNDGFCRTVAQVPPEELRLCLMQLARDSIGLTREDLVKECAQIFGWKRVGVDIERALGEAIDRLIGSGDLVSRSGSLRCNERQSA